MAEITLTEQQVQAANNVPSIPKLGSNAASQTQSDEQINVIMPAKRLEVTGDDEPTPTLQDPSQLNPNQVAKLKGLLDQLDQAPEQAPENLPPTTEGLPRIDELGVSAVPEPQAAPTPTTPDTTTFELPEDENATKFKQAFEKYLGFPLEDLKNYSQQYAQAINELRTIRQDQYYSSAVTQLANTWGIDTATAEGRIDQIQKRFSQYNDEMRARLDNVEGAKLIWARLESEQAQKQNAVPQFQRSRGGTPVSTNDNWMFSEAQLDAMTPEEYARNADKIYQAYQLKLVKPS